MPERIQAHEMGFDFDEIELQAHEMGFDFDEIEVRPGWRAG
jgi:hypothetical protein